MNDRLSIVSDRYAQFLLCELPVLSSYISATAGPGYRLVGPGISRKEGFLKRFAVALRALIDARAQEAGQGLAEYGLILAGVALLAIVAIFALGPKIGELLNRVSASLG